MVVKVITPNDLHTDDFAVQNGKVVVVVTRQNFTGAWARGVAPWNNDPLEAQRRAVTIQDGLGIVHIDFKRTSGTSGLVLTLPDSCPTPSKLIEVQTWDGGSVWLDANSRQVYCNGLTANRRYIVDLLGFFNE